MYDIFSKHFLFFIVKIFTLNYFLKAAFRFQSDNKNMFLPRGLIIILASPTVNIHDMEMCPTCIDFITVSWCHSRRRGQSVSIHSRSQPLPKCPS